MLPIYTEKKREKESEKDYSFYNINFILCN